MYKIRNKKKAKTRKEVDEKLKAGYRFYLVRATNIHKREKALVKVCKDKGLDTDFDIWEISYRYGYMALFIVKGELTNELRQALNEVGFRRKLTPEERTRPAKDDTHYQYLDGKQIKSLVLA